MYRLAREAVYTTAFSRTDNPLGRGARDGGQGASAPPVICIEPDMNMLW